MEKGCFITVEGGEGSGKSTQASLLCQALEERNIQTIQTREPGGSEGAEHIRSLIVTGETDRWDATTETLLFFAARRDHLLKTIWPALDRGKWVISDRFADSTYAYQGAGYKKESSIKKSEIDKLYKIAVGDFKPDLTIIIDLDPEVGIKRSLSRGGDADRFEHLDIEFHKNLRNGYLEIAKNEPERCAIINGERDMASIHNDIMATVIKHFGFEK